MRLKEWSRRIAKLLFLDDILGLACAALAIGGIVLIADKISNRVLMIAMLGLYVVLVPIVWIFLAKKIENFFKGRSE
jgi:hypothetical protein